jgi:hypothetical protein
MRKSIALVLLLSFVDLLWAQGDTCLENENKTANSDEVSVDEQGDEVLEDQLGSLKRPPPFISNQKYYESEQDTTNMIGSKQWKWHHMCCLGVFSMLIVTFLALALSGELDLSIP